MQESSSNAIDKHSPKGSGKCIGLEEAMPTRVTDEGWAH
jgi:hypothetical protein